MKIHYDKESLSKLGVGYTFLDTSSLIAIVSYEKEFSDIIFELKESGRALVTIPSVAFEFARTEDISIYNTRAKFIKDNVSIYPIEKHLSNFNSLIPILQRVNGKMSYTDFLLYCCLYQFNNSLLLIENHKDFTPVILNRDAIFTVDREEKDIRNIALYSFSHDKYEKAAAAILKSNK